MWSASRGDVAARVEAPRHREDVGIFGPVEPPPALSYPSAEDKSIILLGRLSQSFEGWSQRLAALERTAALEQEELDKIEDALQEIRSENQKLILGNQRLERRIGVLEDKTQALEAELEVLAASAVRRSE